MKAQFAILFSLLMVSVYGTASYGANLKPGQPAPDFTLTDSKGKTHKLSSEKGKWVVLEWLNHGCPFVRKHYESKNMQKLQKSYTSKGVVWYSVISSAPGKQGYSTPAEANADVKENGASPTAVLLDPEGAVGKSYGAMTTPHMYVVDPKGSLVYMGAIDDKPTTETSDVSGATNYVSAALDLAMAGKPVAVNNTKAYGCSVKYKN